MHLCKKRNAMESFWLIVEFFVGVILIFGLGYLIAWILKL